MRIALIPARGGSVRLPRKNIRDFRGKPIIAYPIDAAQRARFYNAALFDEIIVSTDDDEIGKIARGLGARVLFRAPDDGSKGTQEVARDALQVYTYAKDACVIYPCSPLIAPSDLERGYAVLRQGHALFSMSVGTEPLRDAGCFYWGRREAYLVRAPLIAEHTVMVPMPERRVCDINTQDDWDEAEAKFDAWRKQRGALDELARIDHELGAFA